MKRINPDTGKPFKSGDKRPSSDIQDRKVFLQYLLRLNKKTGLFSERWITIEQSLKLKIKANQRSAKLREQNALSGEKRINPDTGKGFVSGDPRPKKEVQDGKVFEEYQYERPLKDGKYQEKWIDVETRNVKRERVRQSKQKRKLLKKELEKKNPSHLILELNPLTGQKYSKGDVKDGKIFVGYNPFVEADGRTVKGYWISKEQVQRNHINKIIWHIKGRMKERKEPMDPRINLDYLLSLFPKDSVCPVLGIPMHWGESGGRMTSPSLDRIDNSKGYIHGNLIWMSRRANLIKGNHSLKDIKKVAEFLEKNNFKD